MTTTAIPQFSYLLREFRQRAKISQQELSDVLKTLYNVTLYGSDISKFEREERKPPKIDTTLAMIKALHLSDEEAQRFLEAGNYPPSVFHLLAEPKKEQSEYSNVLPLYPPTTTEQAQIHLQSSLPSWQLSADGYIISTNKLAMWLWMAAIAADLIDAFVFEVFTRPWNLDRILMTGQINDFWLIKLQVMRWMENQYPSEVLERAKRIILENPTLNILYEHLDKLNLDTISFYKYSLFIQHPEIHYTYLRFRVKIWITRTEDGELDRFIFVYEPHDNHTREIVTQKYKELNKIEEDYTYSNSPV